MKSGLWRKVFKCNLTCSRYLRIYKEQARIEGKIYTPLIQLLTDFQGEGNVELITDNYIHSLLLFDVITERDRDDAMIDLLALLSS